MLPSSTVFANVLNITMSSPEHPINNSSSEYLQVQVARLQVVSKLLKLSMYPIWYLNSIYRVHLCHCKSKFSPQCYSCITETVVSDKIPLFRKDGFHYVRAKPWHSSWPLTRMDVGWWEAKTGRCHWSWRLGLHMLWSCIWLSRGHKWNSLQLCTSCWQLYPQCPSHQYHYHANRMRWASTCWM